MTDGLVDVVKRVGIFMVIGQTILHFRPNKQYEKYLKLLISIMIMAQLVIPVLSLGSFDAQANMEKALAEFEQQLAGIEEEVAIPRINAGGMQIESVEDALAGQLEAPAGELGFAVSRVVLFYEENEAGTKASVEKIKIYLKAMEAAGISVGSITIEEKEEIEQAELAPYFAEYLGIREEYLEVVILV